MAPSTFDISNNEMFDMGDGLCIGGSSGNARPAKTAVKNNEFYDFKTKGFFCISGVDTLLCEGNVGHEDDGWLNSSVHSPPLDNGKSENGLGPTGS